MTNFRDTSRNPDKASATCKSRQKEKLALLLAANKDLIFLDPEYIDSRHRHYYQRKSTGVIFLSPLNALCLNPNRYGLVSRLSVGNTREFERILTEKFGFPIQATSEYVDKHTPVTIRWKELDKTYRKTIVPKHFLYDKLYLSKRHKIDSSFDKHAKLVRDRHSDIELIKFNYGTTEHTYRRLSTNIEFTASSGVVLTENCNTFGYSQNHKLLKKLKLWRERVAKSCGTGVKLLDLANNPKYGIFKSECCPNKTWEQRLDSAVLHKVSTCPVCSKAVQRSKVSDSWLGDIEKRFKLSLQREHRFTVKLKSGETKTFRVDGFDSKSKTVFEFYGDAFHGNLNLHNGKDNIHPYDRKITAEKLYRRDKRRESLIQKQHGVKFVTIREYDYKFLYSTWLLQWKPIINFYCDKEQNDRNRKR